jgi:hypothetical protein
LVASQESKVFIKRNQENSTVQLGLGGDTTRLFLGFILNQTVSTIQCDAKYSISLNYDGDAFLHIKVLKRRSAAREVPHTIHQCTYQ